MNHIKSLWFLFWVVSLLLGALSASAVLVGKWQALIASLVPVFGTITAFLAAQWQAPVKPAIEQPEVKP